MELFVRQDLLKTLPQLDAVLLDVDGVILDVAQTFRVVAAEVAQLYATQWMKLEDDGPLFLPSECELFKNAGGFNNDWDLTNGVLALALAKQCIDPSLTTTTQLREAFPDLEAYTAEIQRRGGGLVVAEKYILDMMNANQRRDFSYAWNPRLVTQLFQEMYAGENECRALYGFAPEHVHGEGYLDKEPVLIDASLLPKKTKNGVLTGRIHAETRIALHRSGLLEAIPDTAWVTETDGVRKPDGASLSLLRDKMGFKFGVYIGDTMDDLRVVQNYKETQGSGKAKIISCIVLSGPAGAANRRQFLEAGAEIVAPDINSVLTYLNGVVK